MLLLRTALLVLALLMAATAVIGQETTLPGVAPLTDRDDLSMRMVEGIHAYLDRQIAKSQPDRAGKWRRDLTDAAHYDASVAANRERLRVMLGVVDARLPADLHIETSPNDRPAERALAGAGPDCRIYRVHWSVFRGVRGEGLLLVPARVIADAVALPDCDTTPEMLSGLAAGIAPEGQFARRLAERGCRVLVPFLIDRGATYSGNPAIAITNQPHREFLYRAAYEVGRHILGYEVQKTLAAVDWFCGAPNRGKRPLYVIGHGEGGLVALYAAALDPRIGGAAISGCFGRRERMVREPIYRNVFGLLREFGDAEIAALVAPRRLVIEAAAAPIITGPPKEGRATAASGTLEAYSRAETAAEAARAAALTAGLPGAPGPVLTVSGDGGGPPGCDATISALTGTVSPRQSGKRDATRKPAGAPLDLEARRRRQFDQIAEDTQVLMRSSSDRRTEYWSHADFSSAERLAQTAKPYREAMWDNLVGRLPEPALAPHPRARKVYDTPKFTGFEVTLDLYPDVFAYGILLVPKGIAPGERRPVVVCQHGLEGRPQDCADPAQDSHYYHRFACALAEKGYVTFSPQNPYIGHDRFRTLLRKAQPLGLTLFSFIVRQHEALLNWLAGFDFVDPSRMAFYGLSYGGKTAMRVPSLLPKYCLSICSGDYNEWVWKCMSISSPYSYLFTIEYDMPEWNLANTYNYAEMSWLIFPRPFMVERGHEDGVAPDEWVAYEFARTRRVYDRLGLGRSTEIEFFNGPHTIHGAGTFEFLDRHLRGAK